MAEENIFKNQIPIAPLKIAALPGCEELASSVNDYIVDVRRRSADNIKDNHGNLLFRGYDASSFLLDIDCPRFGTGEGKGIVKESVRGADVYIFADVTNYSITYKTNGITNRMCPDDHYMNLKRIVAACSSVAHRVNVVMPFLYEGRQHRRKHRESLDCAYSLEELTSMGVANIVTFDAHDPRVQNAIPLGGFDNFMATYQFVKTIFSNVQGIHINKDELMIISPDEGGMDRAVYLANNLGIDIGMFYKRRDFSQVVDGRNPIVAHEFLGADVSGKTVIIVDDMISSGDSMIDTARELKKRNASKIIICATFGLFTNGLDKFDEAHEAGIIDYICTTNLNYRNPELLTKSWYLEADMSKYLGLIINSYNHDISIASALSSTYKIQQLVAQYKSDGYEYFGVIS